MVGNDSAGHGTHQPAPDEGRPTIVLATANPKKVVEIREILPDWELLPRPDDIPDVDETELTFEGNARLKAVAICDATGRPALADDSGIEVDALDGAPGVHSAYYAGEHGNDGGNVDKLLAELGAGTDRRARFRAVLILRRPDGSEIVAEGRVEGTIADAPRGEGGFGYDPIFIPDEGDGRTFAEMDLADKHAISHRGRALRELAALVTAG